MTLFKTKNNTVITFYFNYNVPILLGNSQLTFKFEKFNRYTNVKILSLNSPISSTIACSTIACIHVQIEIMYKVKQTIFDTDTYIRLCNFISP